jgi:hypothetical protein
MGRGQSPDDITQLFFRAKLVEGGFIDEMVREIEHGFVEKCSALVATAGFRSYQVSVLDGTVLFFRIEGESVLSA